MNPRRKIVIIILISIGILSTAVIASHANGLQLCPGSSRNCIHILQFGYGLPLLRLSLAIIGVSLFSLVCKKEVMKSFFRYLIITIPIMLLWLFSIPIDSLGGFMGVMNDRSESAFIIAGIFLIISVIVLVTRSIQEMIWEKSKGLQ